MFCRHLKRQQRIVSKVFSNIHVKKSHWSSTANRKPSLPRKPNWMNLRRISESECQLADLCLERETALTLQYEDQKESLILWYQGSFILLQCFTLNLGLVWQIWYSKVLLDGLYDRDCPFNMLREPNDVREDVMPIIWDRVWQVRMLRSITLTFFTFPLLSHGTYSRMKICDIFPFRNGRFYHRECECHHRQELSGVDQKQDHQSTA